MTARLLLSLAAAGGVLLSQPAGARAGGGQVLVVEFYGASDGELAHLSQDMADVVREEGGEATVATREDVLTLAGCPDTSDQCLHDALGVLGAERVVLGEVRASDGSAVEVELRIISADGEPRGRVVRMTGSADEIAPAFKLQAGAFWRGEEPPAEEPVATDPVEEPAPVAADVTAPATGSGAGFSASRVEPYAWWVAGGGAGLVVTGGLFLLAARSKQADVDDAPTDTLEDLEALKDLEDSGRRYARLGSAFVVVGAVAAAVGGVLIYRQGHRAPAEAQDAAITLAPTVSRGGIGLLLTVRAP